MKIIELIHQFFIYSLWESPLKESEIVGLCLLLSQIDLFRLLFRLPFASVSQITKCFPNSSFTSLPSLPLQTNRQADKQTNPSVPNLPVYFQWF